MSKKQTYLDLRYYDTMSLLDFNIKDNKKEQIVKQAEFIVCLVNSGFSLSTATKMSIEFKQTYTRDYMITRKERKDYNHGD